MAICNCWFSPSYESPRRLSTAPKTLNTMFKRLLKHIIDVSKELLILAVIVVIAELCIF